MLEGLENFHCSPKNMFRSVLHMPANIETSLLSSSKGLLPSKNFHPYFELYLAFSSISIIWSDEKKLELFGQNDVQTVWRTDGMAYDPKYVVPTVKHGGGSIMIHGFMSDSGVGELTLIKVSYYTQC